MSSEGSILMVGLPKAGKTTFLAALWHQLESAEIPMALTARELQPDREFLNKIREAWLSYEEVARTSIGIEKSTALHLRHVRTGQDFDLSIPDVAGEVFAMAWRERQIPATYVDQLKVSFGLIMFIHCRQVSSVQALPMVAPTEIETTGDPSSWDLDPGCTPTQVQLIDCLQFVLATVDESRPFRLAVVISAWDEVDAPAVPATWLERELPLLAQFLRANRVRMSFRTFGVSAIGGQLAEKEQLALISSPSMRPQVQVGAESVCDLSLPLEFITIGGS
jgi:hypothetical protein